jgi:hypothetical protein
MEEIAVRIDDMSLAPIEIEWRMDFSLCVDRLGARSSYGAGARAKCNNLIKSARRSRVGIGVQYAAKPKLGSSKIQLATEGQGITRKKCAAWGCLYCLFPCYSVSFRGQILELLKLQLPSSN